MPNKFPKEIIRFKRGKSYARQAKADAVQTLWQNVEAPLNERAGT
jgi:hypothetical protein